MVTMDTTSKFEKKRAHVLAVALELFRTNGYDATSLQEIADASDVLKGSLYYYFKSKSELLADVVETVHQSFSEMLEDYSESSEPLQQIRQLVVNAAIDAGKNQKVLVVFWRELPRVPEDRRRSIINLRDRQDELVHSLIRQAQERGEADPGLDARVAAISIGTLATSVYTWYSPSGRLSLKQIAEELGNFAINGLRARG